MLDEFGLNQVECLIGILLGQMVRQGPDPEHRIEGRGNATCGR